MFTYLIREAARFVLNKRETAVLGKVASLLVENRIHELRRAQAVLPSLPALSAGTFLVCR